MATELVTHVWCDLCMSEDVKREGAPYPVVLRGVRYEIDLCSEHMTPLDELATTLDEHARKPANGKPRKASKKATQTPRLSVVPAAHPVGSDMTCRLCGREYTNNHDLMTHVRQRHHMLAAEYRGEPLTHHCSACGRGFGSGTGLAAHQRAGHPAG